MINPSSKYRVFVLHLGDVEQFVRLRGSANSINIVKTASAMIARKPRTLSQLSAREASDFASTYAKLRAAGQTRETGQ